MFSRFCIEPAERCPPGGPDGQLHDRSLDQPIDQVIGAQGAVGTTISPQTICCLEVVELVGDVVDEAAGRRVAHAVDREVERLRRRRRRRRRRCASIVSYTATSTFFSIEVRMYGCSSADDQVVLVGVDTDRPHVAGLAGGGCRLERAETGATGGGVDDVSAGLVLAGGEFLALGRVVEAA